MTAALELVFLFGLLIVRSPIVPGRVNLLFSPISLVLAMVCVVALPVFRIPLFCSGDVLFSVRLVIFFFVLFILR